MDTERKTVELLVPAYNEEACVELFYRAVDDLFATRLKDYALKILFIDDGSSDNTLDKLKELAAKDAVGRVHYISFSRNMGKEAAIYAGLKNSTGDYVAVMDADLQHPPEMLLDMLHALTKEGYDSCGARREDRKGEGVVKRLFSVIYYHIINRMTVVELTPGSTDFRLMKRSMVDAVLLLCERERFTKGLFAWVGFHTKWLPYHNVERVAGKSKWSVKGLFHYASSGLIAFARAPLRFAVWVGILSLFAAFLYLIVLLVRVLSGGYAPGTGHAIILLLLFFGGMCVLLLGLAGEYLARIMSEVKQRPIYLIRESNLEGVK